MKSILQEGCIGVDMPPLPEETWRGIGLLLFTDLPAFASTSSNTLVTWSNPEEGAITTQGNTGRNGIIRWYDPITGRWLSNDPIGISGGLNQYVFCGDNPVMRRDPFGLCDEDKEKFPDWLLLLGGVAIAEPTPAGEVVFLAVAGGYVAWQLKDPIAEFARDLYDEAKRKFNQPRNDPPWADKPQPPPRGPFEPPAPPEPWWAILLRAIDSFTGHGDGN